MGEEAFAELFEQCLRNIFDWEPNSKRRQTREEILEYHKQYYQRNKDKIRKQSECNVCGHVFADKSALTRHLKRNLKCKLRRAEERLAQIEANSSESSSSSSSAPRDTPARAGQVLLDCLE
jgi:hypothetical protein